MPEVYAEPAPSPHWLTPLWVKDWVRELCLIGDAEADSIGPYIKASLIDRLGAI